MVMAIPCPYLHTHTAAAHEMGRVSGEFSKRAQLCLETVRALGTCTDRQVLTALRMHDMNAVRPRLTELVQDGWLEECGAVIDGVTAKSVRQLRVVDPAERARREERLTRAAEELQLEWEGSK